MRYVYSKRTLGIFDKEWYYQPFLDNFWNYLERKKFSKFVSKITISEEKIPIFGCYEIVVKYRFCKNISKDFKFPLFVSRLRKNCKNLRIVGWRISCDGKEIIFTLRCF